MRGRVADAERRVPLLLANGAMTLPEIAEALGCPPGARQNILTAMLRLQHRGIVIWQWWDRCWSVWGPMETMARSHQNLNEMEGLQDG